MSILDLQRSNLAAPTHGFQTLQKEPQKEEATQAQLSLASGNHPLDGCTAEQLQKLGRATSTSPGAITAAGLLLNNQVSPALIMQQLEGIYRAQAMESKKMSAELAVNVSKIRVDVRRTQLEATQKERNAKMGQAITGLAVGMGSGLLGTAAMGRASFKAGKVDQAGKSAAEEAKKTALQSGHTKEMAAGLAQHADMEARGAAISTMGDGSRWRAAGDALQKLGLSAPQIGSLVGAEQETQANMERTNADFIKNIGDDFSKKTDQMEQNAQELRRRAAETIQTAVSLNAQAQQSVNLKL